MRYKFKILDAVGDIRGKKVFLRLDVNVPIDNGAVRNDYRIRRSLPTLDFLRERGARVVIAGHTDSKETNSLGAVAEYMKKFLPLKFIQNLADAPTAADTLKDGEFLMLENLRTDPGEAANDPAFAKKLAALAEIYINDAFSVSHRRHASIVGVPKLLPGYAGFLLAEEVKNLSRAFNPPKPFLFILGGAKFETKLPLVQKFVKTADRLFVGGALANDLFSAKGWEIGDSTHSETDFDFSSLNKNPKIFLPAEVVVRTVGGDSTTKRPQEVLPTDSIFDAGAGALAEIGTFLKKAKFVLWNGPLGNYEKGFSQGTEKLAKMIAGSPAESIVGGGDTLACIAKLNFSDKFSFVSTGGGAMLEFLANETLPGIEALEEGIKS